MPTPILIVLRGRAKCGKTTAIKITRDKLLALGAKVIFTDPVEKPGEDIVIKLEFRGKKIGIVSSGDARKWQEIFFRAVGEDCDIYICATRSKGETISFIREKFPKSAIYWHKKHAIDREKTQVELSEEFNEKVNQYEADIIVESLLEII